MALKDWYPDINCSRMVILHENGPGLCLNSTILSHSELKRYSELVDFVINYAKENIGWLFLWIWLTHLTQIVSSNSSWDNNHLCVHFDKNNCFHKMMICTREFSQIMFAFFDIFWSCASSLQFYCGKFVKAPQLKMNFSFQWFFFVKMPKVNKVAIIVSAWFITHNLSQIRWDRQIHRKILP